VHSLNVPGMCLHVWPDDGSFEPKQVAEFLILIAVYIVVLKDWNNLLYYCNTQRDGSYKKYICSKCTVRTVYSQYQTHLLLPRPNPNI